MWGSRATAGTAILTGWYCKACSSPQRWKMEGFPEGPSEVETKRNKADTLVASRIGSG